ncbi:MAG: uroporphyrinogen-III synthase [Pirellulales bacterium]|nr:uroporphyrinogen-III synthase [Pirellulales bacterium]
MLVTRAAEGADTLGELLAQRGAKVVRLPVIRIADPPDWAPVDAALDRLDQYDWLVFSSANGVAYLLDRLATRGKSIDRLADLHVAAVGPATAEALHERGVKVAVVPDEYRAEALAEALAPHAPGSRFLLARANRGRDVLRPRLVEAGGQVDQIAVYSSLDVPADSPEVTAVSAQMAQSQIDWVTVTSSAIARSVVRLFGPHLAKTWLASLSPLTTKTLHDLGHRAAVEAATYTTQGLVEAIEHGYREGCG